MNQLPIHTQQTHTNTMLRHKAVSRLLRSIWYPAFPLHYAPLLASLALFDILIIVGFFFWHPHSNRHHSTPHALEWQCHTVSGCVFTAAPAQCASFLSGEGETFQCRACRGIKRWFTPTSLGRFVAN